MQIEEKTYGLNLNLYAITDLKKKSGWLYRMNNLRSNDACVHFFELHVAVIK